MYSSNTDISLNSGLNIIQCPNSYVKCNNIYTSGTIIKRVMEKYSTFVPKITTNGSVSGLVATYGSDYYPKSVGVSSSLIIQAHYNINISGVSYVIGDYFTHIMFRYYSSNTTLNTELDRTYMYYNTGQGTDGRRLDKPFIAKIQLTPNMDSNTALTFSFALYQISDSINITDVYFVYTQIID